MSPEGRKAFESLFPLPVGTAEKRCDRKVNAGEERQGISDPNTAPWANLGRP
jgi:hypothetical protein